MADTESSLSHLSWLCPGLHGKDSRQTIVRRTFRQLFQSEKRLIIPLIQRRYCWNQNTVWRWFEVRAKPCYHVVRVLISLPRTWCEGRETT